MDTVHNYVIPNVVLFGSLYAVAKYVEHATQEYINNHLEYQQKLFDLFNRFR
jgi:hypothetical protein